MLRLTVNADDIFYYPDVMVVCGQNDLQVRYLSEPRLVIEVLSPSTERIDRREKAYHYREAPSVEEYVLIAQHAPHVTICRRSEAWEIQILTSPQEAAEFRSVELSLPLERIYEGVL
jgi:Uma2 family endonuclease